MIIEETSLEGVFELYWDPFTDDRGTFQRNFCEDALLGESIRFRVKQGNMSSNRVRRTLRGFHYQDGRNGENKILSCVSGEILNVVLDLRRDSKSFLQKFSIQLAAGDGKAIYVPSGCANAYLTLEDKTVVQYFMDSAYSAELGNYRGFRYNDPAVDFEWPAEPRVVSEKDLNYPDLRL